MLSAGNDVVSLNDIDVSRTNTKQFYAKILSASEIASFEPSKHSPVTFENYVWLLWSIKESAYKFLKRIHPELLFTPVKFEVNQLDVPQVYTVATFEGPTAINNALDIKSAVHFENYRLYSRSVIYRELIFSVVDDGERFDGVFWGIQKIGLPDTATQSGEVRKFLTGQLQSSTGRENIRISKNLQGVPLLSDGPEELPIPVSLAHHGHFAGYSFKKNSQRFLR